MAAGMVGFRILKVSLSPVLLSHCHTEGHMDFAYKVAVEHSELLNTFVLSDSTYQRNFIMVGHACNVFFLSSIILRLTFKSRRFL